MVHTIRTISTDDLFLSMIEIVSYVYLDGNEFDRFIYNFFPRQYHYLFHNVFKSSVGDEFEKNITDKVHPNNRHAWFCFEYTGVIWGIPWTHYITSGPLR